MPRHFAPITKEELEAKITATAEKHEDFDDYGVGGCLKTLTATVTKDIDKVNFDTENLDYENEDPKYFANHPVSQYRGYQTLDNGFTFLGASGGGDWQWPVFFLIYWDGKKLRGYIPEKGNLWNTDTNEAYGEDDEADLANAFKREPELKKHNIKSFDQLSLDHRMDDIIADIKARILPKK